MNAWRRGLLDNLNDRGTIVFRTAYSHDVTSVHYCVSVDHHLLGLKYYMINHRLIQGRRQQRINPRGFVKPFHVTVKEYIESSFHCYKPLVQNRDLLQRLCLPSLLIIFNLYYRPKLLFTVIVRRVDRWPPCRITGGFANAKDVPHDTVAGYAAVE
jgi:hypothetical protein